MTVRFLTALLVLTAVETVAFPQAETSQRRAYVPTRSPRAQEQKEEQDPTLRKLSPELAAMVTRNLTYIGQERDGSVVVEGQAADMQGLENIRAPGDPADRDVRSEQLIVRYPRGNTPTEESLNRAGFDLLDSNEDGFFVVVAPVPIPENRAARAPGIQPVEFRSLAEVPQTLNISRNVILSIPDQEMSPEIVPASQFQVNASSSTPELDKVPGIRRTGADRLQSISDPSQVIVAVIDTGVEYDHDDLKANMWVNEKERNGRPNFDDDGNGVIDDVFGARFVNGRISGDPRDDNGHGTHCAGTIAAVANGTGVVGMAQTRVMALKFLARNGGGLTSDAVRCIDYARKNGARVISNSWGSASSPPKALEEAIERAQLEGILFVVAAGNDNKNIDNIDYSPANSRNDNVLTVGSINAAGGRSGFSNFGKQNVDIGAPGGTGPPGSDDDILSTWLNNDFAYLAGTSMATPHVSGAAALLLGTPQFRDADFVSLKQGLLNNAQRNLSLDNAWKGGRELNLRFLLNGTPGGGGGKTPGDGGGTPTGDVPEKAFFYADAKEFKSTTTLITRRLRLNEKATINLLAGASAAGVTGRQTFATGITIGSTPHQSSFRVVTTSGENDYVTFGTSLTTTLEAGTHDVSWWIRLPKNGRLAVRGGGSLDVQAFKIGPN